MTPFQLLKETLYYYQTHPRATSTTTSYYCMERRRLCAIGRCLKNPAKFQKETSGQSVKHIPLEYFQNNLQEEYINIPLPVWIDIQKFHDTSSFWKQKEKPQKGNILTEKGLERYNKLREVFAKYN